ncbi:MAG: phosphoribosylanthranilate isomerase [Halodesulfurarchaeum sp.]
MVRVKVCGHTRRSDVEESVQAGVDAVGVVVDVPVETPRAVSPETAADLLSSVPPFVTGVLVTIQERALDVLDLVETVGPDAVQVHAGLSQSELQTLARDVPIPLIVGTDVGERDRIQDLAAVADAILLDSRDERGGGGTGRRTDWESAREIARSIDVPLVLAGGLDPDNVASAIDRVDPYGVDVASGVEADGGIKDPQAVRAFLDRATGGVRVSS